MLRQNIFTRRYWHNFRIDWQRSDHDPLARKRLWFRFLYLIYLMAVVTYYSIFFSSFHDPETAIAIGVIAVGIFAVIHGVAWAQDRAAKKEMLADIASAPAATTSRVQQLAHGLAAMTERALGEAWLRHNKLPDGHSPLARRNSIEALRRHGVWDEMPAEARDWIMRPDGAWPPERVNAVLMRAETLNTLLWALALQPTLRPLEDLLKALSMQRLVNSLQTPARGIRPTWEMRSERNRAMNYFNRCYAEGIHRGQFLSNSPERSKAVERWVKEIHDTPGSDFLAGAATIAELDEESLRRAAMSAISRADTLRLLMDVLDDKDVWQELNMLVYGSLL